MSVVSSRVAPNHGWGRNESMATIVLLKFDTSDGAEKCLGLVESLQKQKLLQIIDAATVI